MLYAHPYPRAFPGAQVLIDALPLGEIGGQPPPLAPAFGDIKMALSTARMHKVRGRPPLLAAGISSLIHSHSSSVRSLGYVFSFIFPFYTTHEDFSDRLLGPPKARRFPLRITLSEFANALNADHDLSLL